MYLLWPTIQRVEPSCKCKLSSESLSSWSWFYYFFRLFINISFGRQWFSIACCEHFWNTQEKYRNATSRSAASSVINCCGSYLCPCCGLVQEEKEYNYRINQSNHNQKNSCMPAFTNISKSRMCCSAWSDLTTSYEEWIFSEICACTPQRRKLTLFKEIKRWNYTY